MDVCDQADIQNEKAIAAALTLRKPVGPEPNGYCFNCRSELPEGQRYCDADCAKDHTERLAARRRNGERND